MTLSHESSISATPAGVGQAAPMAGVGRARRTDPATSHQAGERASRFFMSHQERIHAALRYLGTATAADISAETGLTVVQIDRRLTELQRSGRIALVMQGGQPVQRGGFRVWMVA